MRKLSMQELGRLSTQSFKDAEKIPLVVVLDNVRSGLNVGSVFRTSDAFLVEAIHICGYSAQPPHRDVLKSALGSTETVVWSAYESVEESISLLKNQGYLIYAIEQVEDAVLLNEFKIQKGEKIAIVFGNEVSGVSEEALKLVDGAIEVPQWGTKHSLNISVCAGIVIWEIALKMKF
ncbi:MAG: TrmH family RNA methyltransferase [Chitinophagales bacterium]|nr:TrmH family RNA methyltransferase [Chitinophagales bacterium]MCZ2394294.1 TrmH family RNA methyltransferase [Chitinophagales bacterium]